MSEMLDNLQHRLKSTSTGIFLTSFRILFGAFLGLTISLVGERAFGYGDFSFAFVIVLTTLLFIRFSKGWKTSTALVFALVCILLGLLLRMYVLVAPGH